MISSFDEMFTLINNYYGDSVFLIIAIISCIYLFVYYREIGKMIILPSLVILFLLLNPFLYKVIFSGGRYWRFFWALPCIMVIAVAFTEFVKNTNGKYSKILVAVALFSLIVLKGTNVYKNAGFSKMQNYYKLSDETVSVCNAVLNIDDHPRCIFPQTLFCEARQYSGEIELLYGRGIYGYIIRSSDELQDVYNGMEGETPDYDLVLSKAGELNYSIVVTYEDRPIDEEILRKYGFMYMNTAKGYNIYAK